MKSFKEYLTENKKVYEFKVKIVGECPTDCSSQIKTALSQFHVASVSAGKRTPIQERHSEFPEHKNVNMTVFDITTNYPATNKQVADIVASGLGMSHSSVKVKSMAEELEHEINHKNDKRTGKAVLGTDYESSDNSDLVGEKRKMNFLQELNKEKHQGTQVKGHNDKLLALDTPKHAKETTSKQVNVTKNIKNIFTKQVKVPTAKGVK
jgi:hypothetical protein